MTRIEVATEKPYEVRIENGLLEGLGKALREKTAPCTVTVITDDTVDGLYGRQVVCSLESQGFRVERFVFAHGEQNKTLETWQDMVRFLADKQLTRGDVALALGGGVTGDMAGFAAASYLRGIPFVQAPTTLLAMVDSSVGGKTGVNLPHGKNLLGAFYQPMMVLCDPKALTTLPRDILLDGVAEAIKMGVLGDGPLFDLLASGHWQGEEEEVIARCVRAKAQLVSQDEKDQGKRQLLNLGHTLGHAIETRSNHLVSHGKAVAMGMAHITRLAVRLGFCPESCLEKVLEALKRNGLPVQSPYPWEELVAEIARDKKRAGALFTLVVPENIGACQLRQFSFAQLQEALPKAWE